MAERLWHENFKKNSDKIFTEASASVRLVLATALLMPPGKDRKKESLLSYRLGRTSEDLCCRLHSFTMLNVNVLSHKIISVIKYYFFSLIYPCLHYCISLWGSTYPSNLNRLIVLQKAVRIMSMFKVLKILKLNYIFVFQIGKILFQFMLEMLSPFCLMF